MAGFVTRFEAFCLRCRFGVPMLIGTVLLGAWLSHKGAALFTDAAPLGEMSLQLAGSAAAAKAVVKSWASVRHQARLQVIVDLPFVVFYAATLFHFGLWARRRALAAGEQWLAAAARVAAWGGLAAGILDFIEDWGLWVALRDQATDAVAARTAFCATAKFALIATGVAIPLFAGFARQPASFATPLSWNAMLRITRPTVGALGIAALGLVVPPQTRDMLAGASWHGAREIWSGLAFHLSLLVLGLSAWYWSRAALSAWFDTADTANARPMLAATLGADPTPLEWAPRLLFAAAAAIGVIAALRSGAWLQVGAILVWALAVLFVLYSRLRWGWYRVAAPVPWVVRLGGIGNLLERAPGGPYLAILVLAVAALAFLAGLVGALLPASRFWGWAVYNIGWSLPGPAAALVFLGLSLGPLTVLSYAADRLRWGGTLGGLRLTMRPPVFLALVAVVLVVPALVDLHAVRVAAAPQLAVGDRRSLDDLFAAWFEKCVQDKRRDATVRPVIVALSGGASRAGLWGARVLVAVDAAAQAGGTGIFAVSTVSGGSLGAAAYLASLAGQQAGSCTLVPDNRVRFRDAAMAAIGDDALGPALAGALFGDIPRALFGVPLTVIRHAWAALRGVAYEDSRGGDRAEALERSFERNWSAAVRADLAVRKAAPDRPLSFARPSMMLTYLPGRSAAGGKAVPRGAPVWIANGTDPQNGERILTVPFDDGAWPFAGALDALGLLGRDVPVSTAIHNTARFAFLSPAGELTPVSDAAQAGYATQLIDGGYFENEGLLTAWELASHLETRGPAILAAISGHAYKVKPVLVEATADADAKIAEDRIIRCWSRPGGAPTHHDVRESPSQSLGTSRPLQALAPLLGLYSVRGGHSGWILRRVAQEYCADDPVNHRFFHFYLYREREYLPLNWTLSRRVSCAIWTAMDHQAADGNYPNLDEMAALTRSLTQSKPAGLTAQPEAACPAVDRPETRRTSASRPGQ
jgi:hypothetical protein